MVTTEQVQGGPDGMEATVTADGNAKVPEPAEPYRDDLGLTSDDWHDLRVAYIFGTLEPFEGSIQAEAFRRIAERDRREAQRRAEREEVRDARRRYAARPFPGGPLTRKPVQPRGGRARRRPEPRLRGRVGRAARGRKAGQRAQLRFVPPRGQGDARHRRRRARRDPHLRARHPFESPGEFRRRAHREPSRLPDSSLFPLLAHPDTRAEAASRAEPPWAEHEAEP